MKGRKKLTWNWKGKRRTLTETEIIFISRCLKPLLSTRLKEKLMKMSSQMKHDEEKRRSLQVGAFSFVALKNLPKCLQTFVLSAGGEQGCSAGGSRAAGASAGQ